MKSKKNAAFTLIELLIVVLIIGILAAVALPQYQAAVDKSRFMGFLPLLRSIKDSQERYFMANGNYTLDMGNLDIQIPENCQKKDQTVMLRCGEDWILDNVGAYGAAVGFVQVTYCPGLAREASYLTCYNNRTASLRYFYDRYAGSYGTAGQIICENMNGNTRGLKLCRTINSAF